MPILPRRKGLLCAWLLVEPRFTLLVLAVGLPDPLAGAQEARWPDRCVPEEVTTV